MSFAEHELNQQMQTMSARIKTLETTVAGLSLQNIALTTALNAAFGVVRTTGGLPDISALVTLVSNPAAIITALSSFGDVAGVTNQLVSNAIGQLGASVPTPPGLPGVGGAAMSALNNAAIGKITTSKLG